MHFFQTHDLNRRQFLAATMLAAARLSAAADTSPLNLGSRRELFVDDFLIERFAGKATLRLHSPTPREIVLIHDRPWEGSGCCFHTIFRDGDRIRMYYTAGPLTNEDGTRMSHGPFRACYAESKDGLHWDRPDLGLWEYAGSKKNNIIWQAPDFDNIAVFKDTNPNCRPGEKYKATTLGRGGLFALKSADGLHWSYLRDTPILTKGTFDSQNVAFWDSERKHYWCYFRDFLPNGQRVIRVATSSDFLTWSEPTLLSYVDSPEEHLYTNQVIPYYRALHLFVGFPTRYLERQVGPSLRALPDPVHRTHRMKHSPRYGTALTEGLFMSSRDGRQFHRWGEAFYRPGIARKHNWLYGDGYQNWGLIETPAADADAPPELSLYFIEDNWKRATRLRRATLRLDGFVSLHAPLKGGEILTKPFTFAGKELTLNVSTSAAGDVMVELQNAAGQQLPSYNLADCDEIYCDTLDRVVTWKGQADLSSLAGQPIRLRIVLRDADLFSFQFRS